jgi:YVTN family beta-propeller protein
MAWEMKKAARRGNEGSASAGEIVGMKWRKFAVRIGMSLVSVILTLAGCGGGGRTNVVTVIVSPSALTIVVNQQQSFSATVNGASNTSVTWTLTISGSSCSPGCGTIDSTTNATITYTAPAKIPSSLVQAPGSTTAPPPLILTATSVANTKKTGTATITLDSGIRVGITPANATVASGATGFTPEQFKFTGTAVNDTAANPLTWLVTQATTLNASAATCSPGCGSVDSTGLFIAPATLPKATSVTVLAFDKTDTTRFATATVTLVDPTKNIISFTGITPTIAPLGGLQQDVYLNVTNLRSTISILFDGVRIDPNSTQLKIINAAVARLRLNATQLSTAGTHVVAVVDQQGNSQNENIQVVPVRPALVGAVPNSFQQTTGSSPLPGQFSVDGGYFGPSSSPAVKVLFQGQERVIVPPGGTNTAGNDIFPRRLDITLDTGINGSDFSTPGLFPVSVVNDSSNPSSATSNIAIQPDLVGPPLPTTIIKTLPLPGANGVASSVPSAIAVDSTAGLAVVTEQASNSVQIISLAGATLTPGVQVTSPFNQPTGVAIDDQLATHLAAVVNSGNSTLTMIQLPSGSVAGTASLGSLIPAASGTTAPTPYAVGIDPFTHLALVAFSKTNVGFIVNVNPSNLTPGCIGGTTGPFCPVASVSLNTGPKPQIAFEPRLHLAFVTPGGGGLMSVVDLTHKNSVVPIAAAPNGAVRSNNIVTISTGSTPHNINPAVGGTVLITGVTPSDFNGSFQVLSVIDAFTFTYAETGPNESGGGGSLSFGNPSLTFAISNTDQGIAINTETREAVVADPNASFGQISFVSTLDESVTSLTLQVGSFLATAGTAPEIGATWVAVQPFTNVALSLNPSRNEVSFIDPQRPQRLAPAFSTCQGLLPPCPIAIGSYTPPGGSATVTVTGGLAVDPVTNLALVVNSGSNSLEAISIGNTAAMKPVHIRQVQIFKTDGTAYEIPGAVLPQAVLSSNSTLPPGVALPVLGTIKILGVGFHAGSLTGADVQVTLDGTPLPAGSFTVVSDEEIDVPVSPTFISSFLSLPRHYALEVQDTSLTLSTGQSNAGDFTVLQTIDVSGGCSGTSTPQPGAVAIDEQRNIAVVSNSGCNDISILDLTPGAATPVKKSVAVGTSPAGVAVIPRLGFAVVANNGSGSASVINLDTATVAATVTVQTKPLGAAINQDTGAAVIANNGSNTVSLIDLTVLKNTPPGTPRAISGAVDQQPIAVAIDPDRGTNGHGLAVVTALQLNGTLPPSGIVDVVDIGGGAPAKQSTASVTTISATPTGAVLDNAVSPAFFYITSSDGNTITAFNPDTGQTRTIRVGVNPTSLAYNSHTGTIITINTASKTISVIDSQTFQTRATFGIGGSPQFAVAIHPRTNMAVIADQTNNRVLLYPLPR